MTLKGWLDSSCVHVHNIQVHVFISTGTASDNGLQAQEKVKCCTRTQQVNEMYTHVHVHPSTIATYLYLGGIIEI